jgi:plastocyanin
MSAVHRRAVSVVVAVAAVLTACSNSEGSVNRRPQSGTATASVVGSVQQITVMAGDDYRFHPATITVHPGEVEVVLKHTGTGAPHNWQLTAFPADFVPTTAAGQTSTASFMAPAPGRYQFVCTIHVRQGQVGTLVVTPR